MLNSLTHSKYSLGALNTFFETKLVTIGAKKCVKFIENIYSSNVLDIMGLMAIHRKSLTVSALS